MLAGVRHFADHQGIQNHQNLHRGRRQRAPWTPYPPYAGRVVCHNVAMHTPIRIRHAQLGPSYSLLANIGHCGLLATLTRTCRGSMGAARFTKGNVKNAIIKVFSCLVARTLQLSESRVAFETSLIEAYLSTRTGSVRLHDVVYLNGIPKRYEQQKGTWHPRWQRSTLAKEKGRFQHECSGRCHHGLRHSGKLGKPG